MKRLPMAIVLLSGFLAGARAAHAVAVLDCTGEKSSAWGKKRQEGLKDEGLYRFAVALAGPATRCETKNNGESKDDKPGTLILYFKDGTTYHHEDLLPETSAITLMTPAGFKNEPEAVAKLKGIAGKADLKIDWSKPEMRKSADSETKTFWSAEEGTNARAFLEYKNGHLISVGYGMAL
jgi:hypothetical protein